MGVVAGGAGFNHPLACPVLDTLAVGAAHPVFFLPKVALAAQFIAVIHVHNLPRLGDQGIAFFAIVTGKAGERFFFAAMVKGNAAVSDLCRLGDVDGLVVVTLAALKAGHFIFARFRPKTFPTVAAADQHPVFGQIGNRSNGGIINGCNRLFIRLGNAGLT